ncbi:MAG: Cof-type HAD-IIB family hydrolase [Treponema sp.]|nr:Cof-type HAD-IIB family hydrolase [Treponema sp.]
MKENDINNEKVKSQKFPAGKIAPKLIALDLDDSLLNNKLLISDRTVDVIKKAAAQKIYIAICSGRSPSAILPFVRRLDLAGTEQGRYAVASNGSVVLDLHERREIYSAKVSGDVLVRANKAAADLGLPSQVYSSSKIYVGVDNKYTRMDSELTGMPLELVQGYDEFLEQGFAKMIIPGDPEILISLQKSLSAELKGKAVVLISKPYFLEVMPPNCGKGEALEFLCGRLGIGMKEVMAFGDSMNDETMIVKCGMSVGMSNGLEEIKNKAAYVTRLTNDQDGIADFVEQFVLI